MLNQCYSSLSNSEHVISFNICFILFIIVSRSRLHSSEQVSFLNCNSRTSTITKNDFVFEIISLLDWKCTYDEYENEIGFIFVSTYDRRGRSLFTAKTKTKPFSFSFSFRNMIGLSPEISDRLLRSNDCNAHT